MVLPSVHEHEGPGVIYAGSQHFSSYHLLTGLQVRAAHAPRLKAGSNKGVIDSTEGLLWVAFKEREEILELGGHVLGISLRDRLRHP